MRRLSESFKTGARIKESDLEIVIDYMKRTFLQPNELC